MVTVDLNCDLGESFGAWRMGDDDALLPLITTANVACGFHAGDPQTMLATCRAAAALGVTVAAHPGYRDLVGFGRRDIAMAPDALRADLLYQVSALAGLAVTAGTAVRALKPHGALYNRAAVDPVTAAVVAEVGAERGLPVLGLAGSAMQHACAAAGTPFIAEAFVDRGYRPDGTLAPRGEPGAVLTEASAVAARAVRMVREGRVEAVDGTALSVRVQSLCVHSDTPGAVAIARAVRDALLEAGVTVQAAA